ncbi:TauD/TfdA dioxygenase family protein [Azotobacter vinelandii]
MYHYKHAKSVVEPVPIEQRYRHIRPRPQMPDFAAEVDIDLSRPLDEPVREELRQALRDFEVLFLTPQELTPEQHLKLASVFGPVAQGAYFPRKDSHPQIEVLANDARRPASVDHWHSDLTWLEEPPAGVAIQLVEIPANGGNTAWASMSKAFAALSPGLQEYLRGLRATHTWEISQWRNYLANLGEEVLLNSIRRFKPVSHPVVQKHPQSGKEILYVNETFTRNIDDVPPQESREILRFLCEWLKQPEFVHSHRWQRNGIAIWDNLATQHYALADYWPHSRVNQRVTFNAQGSRAPVANTLAEVGGLGVESRVAYGY